MGQTLSHGTFWETQFSQRTLWACARQFRKAPTGRFRGRGGGPGGAQRAAQENSDNEWLAQIYGQHTIYRRDEGLAAAAPAEEEAKEAVAA